MERFPHLKFIQKVTGKPRFPGGGSDDPKTEYNKANRQSHSSSLSQQTKKIQSEWANAYFVREELGLATLDENTIPIFLQINPGLIRSEFDLENLGIEIISEEDNGFLIGASLDNLRSLEDKISGFTSAIHGTGIIADLWQIISGNREDWKPEHILSEHLFENWKSIQDDILYKLEVSIAFDYPLAPEPDHTKQGGEKRLQAYRQEEMKRDEKLRERESHFQQFINTYGQQTSSIINLEDSFACEVKITGKGLKDLVINYPFVFEVTEIEKISVLDSEEDGGINFEIDILPPEFNSPEVGVIDSGIMEGHKYFAGAINSGSSKCYIQGETSTADEVKGGGHGTKVAGAILYPNGVSNLSTPYRLPCFIRNLKVLDNSNHLVSKFPAALMKEIVDDNSDCSIFNLSINSTAVFRKKHMSSWAASIDSMIYTNNVLFVISTGNISRDLIKYYIRSGDNYPFYLQKPYGKIANPAQSSFALSVGSINHAQFEDNDWMSLGKEGDVSAFSRIGSGIWGEIKPDVVEYGGGLVKSKNNLHLIKENENTVTELIRSTLYGGGTYAKDSSGTSFAAPKVTHIVAQLKKMYPNENINLLRALVIQGARLPNHHFQNPTKESIEHFGYGLPSLERVTTNKEQRISFFNTGSISAEEGHIYSLKLPDSLTNQGDEYDILIEVTLAYTAKVRRTRQKTKSYLATWLDWATSKLDESYNDFKDYTLKVIDNVATEYDKEKRDSLSDFPWKIRERADWGAVRDISRNNSSAQKDWAIIKSYDLPKEISFAVRAHKGWDKNKQKVPYALTVSIEVLNLSLPIYELIRIENEIEIPV